MEAPVTTHSEAQSAAVKTRAACDECRIKKLKCTGERPACYRCVREKIPCVYSPQKQMGRPKKRLRGFDAEEEEDGGALDNHQQVEEQQHAMQGMAGVNAENAVWAPDAGAGHWGDANNGTAGNSEGFDMAVFDSAFTPGGSVQPWLLQADGVGDDGEAAVAAAAASAGGERRWDSVGGLTPDQGSAHSTSSSNGNNNALEQHLSHAHAQPHQQHHDHDAPIAIPPDLTWAKDIDAAQSSISATLPTCACLSTMYLTLTELQTMDPAFTFPFALHPLRNALQVTNEVIACPHCPTRFITAIQNTQLIGTMLVAMAERFSKILEAINAESTRAEAVNETKKFRLTDLNTATSHLHLGGLQCRAAFNIDVSAAEWRSMAKKVVKAEVLGPSDGDQCCPSLKGVMKLMEERQERWHHMPVVRDCPKDLSGRAIGGARVIKKEDHVCLKMVGYADMLVREFDWS